MKPLALAATVLALAASVSPARAQMAVYDSASYAKLIEQATTALNQLRQLENQVRQGEQLFQSLNQGSNVTAIASALEAPALRQLLPEATAFSSAARADIAALGDIGARAQALRNAARIYAAPTGDSLGADLEASGMRAARDQALGEAVASGGARRLAGLQILQQAIDAAPTARAVLDLQARAMTEQAMAANDQMRLQGLAMVQAAEDRTQMQRDRERAAAARDARMSLFKQAFQ